MPIFTNQDYDVEPDDIWGDDFERDPVETGTPGWMTDEGFVPDDRQKIRNYMNLVGEPTTAES